MDSNKYDFVSKNLCKILNPIKDNQNILRYLTYTNNNPLSKSLADVNNPYIIWDYDYTKEQQETSRIFLDLLNEDILSEDKMMVFFHPWGSEDRMVRNTSAYGFIFIMTIVIPSSCWTLKGKRNRAYELASEIAKEIDGKHLTDIGDIKIITDRVGKPQNGFRTLTLQIKVENVVFNG